MRRSMIRWSVVATFLAILAFLSALPRGYGADSGVFVWFSDPCYTVYEGQGSIKITVLTSDHPNDPVTVFYSTSDGTAVAPDDYTAVSGQLTFAAGVNSQYFYVDVVNGGATNGPATVYLSLSNPEGAEIGLGDAVLIINDGNVPTGATVSFEFSSWSVGEPDGTVTITVRLVGTPSGTVSVDYATVEGSATPGSDYYSTSGTLTWQVSEAGTTKSFTVTIINDTVAEPLETFDLILSNPVNAALGTQSMAVVAILDDDTDCGSATGPGK